MAHSNDVRTVDVMSKLILNILVSGINVFILSRYIYLLYQKKISPSLAMWVFFSLAVGISMFTYFADGDFNISDNILNFSDLILVIGVSIAILIWGDLSTRFNRFDLGCFAAVFLIIIYWAISNDHLVTNFSVQTIMVISYFPTVKRMINQKKNIEAFSIWIALFINPFISLIANKGMLADLYAGRAILCTGIFLILMIRIELRNKMKSKAINSYM